MGWIGSIGLLGCLCKHNGQNKKKRSWFITPRFVRVLKPAIQFSNWFTAQCLYMLYQCLNQIHTQTQKFMYTKAFFGATPIIILLYLQRIHIYLLRLRIIFILLTWFLFSLVNDCFFFLVIVNHLHNSVYQISVLQLINVIVICDYGWPQNLWFKFSIHFNEIYFNRTLHSIFIAHLSSKKYFLAKK